MSEITDSQRRINLGRAAAELVAGPHEAAADPLSAIIDTVTDLTHYAHSKGISWTDVLRVAADHFNCEYPGGVLSGGMPKFNKANIEADLRIRAAEIANKLAEVRDWCEIPEMAAAGINGVIDELNGLADQKTQLVAGAVCRYAPSVQNGRDGTNCLLLRQLHGDEADSSKPAETQWLVEFVSDAEQAHAFADELEYLYTQESPGNAEDNRC